MKKGTDLLLYLAALLLPFLHLLLNFPLLDDTWLFVGIMAFLALLFTYGNQRIATRYFSLGIAGVVLLLALGRLYVLQQAANAAYNIITQVYSEHSTYLFNTLPVDEEVALQPALWQLAGSIVLLMMLFIEPCIRKGRHTAWVFLLGFLPFFPSLLYRSPTPWVCTIALFMLWGYLFFTSLSRRHQESSKSRYGIGVYAGVCILLSSVLFLQLFPPQEYVEDSERRSLRNAFIARLNNFTFALFHGSEETGEVDLSRAGDRSYTGEEVFTLQREKNEPLYIKTLSTARYEDNTWRVLPQSTYEKAAQIAWERIRPWMGTYTVISDPAEYEEITIYDTRGNTQYVLEPYGVVSIHSPIQICYDAYAQYDDESTIRYRIWDDDSQSRYVSEAESAAYIAFAQAEYTQLPQDIKEVFDRRLEPADAFADQEEIIAYIDDYLSEHYSYTLTPGSPPADEDFVTWFLTKNKRGYCVHFASSATLMLRYYGIPARYVQGYRVNSYNTEHKGIAYDDDAHAWAEIFLPEYGWVPVECTPGYQQYDKPWEDDHLEGGRTEVNEPPTAPSQTSPTQTQQQQMTQQNQELIESPQADVKATAKTQELPRGFWFVLGSLILIIVLIAVYRLRRQRHQKRMRQADRQQAAFYLYRCILRLKPYGAVCTEELQYLYDKAAFSRQGIDEAEYRQMLQLVEQQTVRLQKQLTFRKKLYVRYLRIWL